MNEPSKLLKNMRRYYKRSLPKHTLSVTEDQDPTIIVVIPAYHELQLFRTIHSLDKNNSVDFEVHVIVVLNSTESSPTSVVNIHRKQSNDLKRESFQQITVHPILIESTPDKIGGVGFARKYGMDIAHNYFLEAGTPYGLIACLDGDCTVSINYLEELRRFQQQATFHAGHFYFEHEFPSDKRNRKAIIEYELHLRLMYQNLRYIGHPQAFHAVGSCLVVFAWAYAAQGGMNTRQAGEDFYFIHKFTKIGRATSLNMATVYPSARQSDRVPFGTGAAINKFLRGQNQMTYNFKSYQALAHFLAAIPGFYTENYNGLNYLYGFKEIEIKKRIEEARNNSTDGHSFGKRFLQFFDAFQVIKFLHYLRDRKYPDVAPLEAYNTLSPLIQLPRMGCSEDALIELRKLEKSVLAE